MTGDGKQADPAHLSRRERQIMDVLYAAEEATAVEVQAGLPQSPGYSAVRALLKKLVEKGHATYRQEGARYVYRPVLAKETARAGAFRRLLNTFFGGSPRDAVVGFLGQEKARLSRQDLDAIEAEIQRLKAGRE